MLFLRAGIVVLIMLFRVECTALHLTLESHESRLFYSCLNVIFQELTHGTDLSCVCTRELLTSSALQMW